MQRDPAFAVLLPFLQGVEGKTLWVADEAALDFVKVVTPSTSLSIISNRFDVVMAAQTVGHQAIFSDFDFSQMEKQKYVRIVYRFSKEKAVVHHVINYAANLLVENGELILSGLKSDGAKTYLDKCKQLFGNGSVQKNGVAYGGVFQKTYAPAEEALLDDRNYTRLRLVQTEVLDFWSKPGVFGWDRIDEGSALLVSVLDDFLAREKHSPQSVLDLGCGYGYLSLMLRTFPFARRVAADNCAAALLAMRANAEYYATNMDVVASDAGNTVQETFDLLVCNPPFHRGAAVADDLIEHFLRQAARLLNRQGVAVFVVNAFIPAEQKAAAFFSSCELLVNNRSYKVLALRK